MTNTKLQMRALMAYYEHNNNYNRLNFQTKSIKNELEIISTNTTE